MNFLEHANKIFFVGIGGIGTSGLARLCKAQGMEVTGSDSVKSALTKELEEEEIKVHIGHKVLPDDVDLLIYSEAVPADNPERSSARENGIEELSYFEALGQFTENYRVVAVAGTHGKTTTTAMLGLILIHAGLSPNVLVGTKVKEFGNSNVHVGESDLFVVEACEYRRNFLPLQPSLLGVTNMEYDHMDYFKSFDDYQSAFEELAGQSDEVVWPDEIAEYEGELQVIGQYNQMNAGMAANLARRLGVSELAIAEALAEFKGTWRRFELRGQLYGAPVYDDYAHHPTEIMATLEATRGAYPDRRIVAVFEPHQYSRTIGLLDAFAHSFEEADEVIISSIYEVRDSQAVKDAVSAESLANTISEHHESAHFIDGYRKTAEYLNETIGEEDLVLIMGAGPVNSMINFLELMV
jgi:UDP-N-acetylmuramate--alanine ligase